MEPWMALSLLSAELATQNFAHIRAVYTTENKPRITQSAAYVSRELLV